MKDSLKISNEILAVMLSAIFAVVAWAALKIGNLDTRVAVIENRLSLPPIAKTP